MSANFYSFLKLVEGENMNDKKISAREKMGKTFLAEERKCAICEKR